MITVLLIEDSAVMREAIINLLYPDPEIQLLSATDSLWQAIELTERLRPQVIVMDIHLTRQGHVPPAQVRASFAASKVVAISLAKDAQTKGIADSYGAVTLLDKMNLAVELIPAIKKFAQE